MQKAVFDHKMPPKDIVTPKSNVTSKLAKTARQSARKGDWTSFAKNLPAQEIDEEVKPVTVRRGHKRVRSDIPLKY